MILKEIYSHILLKELLLFILPGYNKSKKSGSFNLFIIK